MPVAYDPSTGNYVDVILDGHGRVVGVRPLNLQQAGVLPVEPGPRPESLKRMLAGLPERITPDQARSILAQQQGSPEAPRMRRILDGALQNNRGNSVTVQIGGTTTEFGNDPTLRFSVAESPREMEDAEAIVVTLGRRIVVDNPIPLSAGIFATALIKWGVGGAQFEAEIDWARGTTFALAASYVKIDATVPRDLGNGPIRVEFSASFAYGATNSRGFSSPARRTVIYELLAGASVTIPVPLWANSFGVISTGTPNLLLDVQQRNGNPSGSYTYSSRDNTANNGEGQFPLPGDADQIVVTNNGGVQDLGRIIFNLAI